MGWGGGVIVIVITWPRENCHRGLAPDRVDDSLTSDPEYPGLEMSPPDPGGEAQCGTGQAVCNGELNVISGYWRVWCGASHFWVNVEKFGKGLDGSR